MKTELEVYEEVLKYIEGDKHNRPCTLQSIKKILRSQRLIDLIFSRPDIFMLESEIKHVPEECLTENVLVKYVLSNPKNFETLDESLQKLPVLVAFEFSKRRYELISKYHWGSCAEKIPYSENSLRYGKKISDICNDVAKTISDNPNEYYILHDYLSYIEMASKAILDYCKGYNIQLEPEKKYQPKYFNVDFGIAERLFIFVSGKPDSGKTSLSNILSSRISNSVHLDSDVLLERNLLCAPLTELVKDNTKVIILSDLYADKFFQKHEIGNAKVVNILIEPISVEVMHRNSKYMSYKPFEEYKRYEIDKIQYEHLENPIIVINNYSGTLAVEVDKVLEEISRRLDVELSVREEVVRNVEEDSQTLRRTLKPSRSNNDI